MVCILRQFHTRTVLPRPTPGCIVIQEIEIESADVDCPPLPIIDQHREISSANLALSMEEGAISNRDLILNPLVISEEIYLVHLRPPPKMPRATLNNINAIKISQPSPERPGPNLTDCLRFYGRRYPGASGSGRGGQNPGLVQSRFFMMAFTPAM